MAKKLTAKDLDAMTSEQYSPPTEPMKRPEKVASFDTQEEAAKFVKDMMILTGQGAAHGYGEEAIAAAKTGSISSPEYLAERDVLRQELQKKREEYPILGPLAESAGAIATTSLIPGSSSTRVKDIASAIIQGTGEAGEIEDMPKEALKSGIIQTGMEAIGAGAKALIADDPTKILTRSVGATRAQTKLPSGRAIQDSVERLNKVGFFKQGDVVVDVNKQNFKRFGKSLDTFFKPQSLDSLYERANNSLSLLKEANNKLIANKTISQKDLLDTLNKGVAEMSYDPEGFGVSARLELARETSQTIIDDLIQKGKLLPNKAIKASDIEEAKKALDMHIGSNAFKKKAEELALNPEAISLFRKRLDELVDKVGGPTYKKNNDLMSDLMSVRNTIESKLNADYAEAGQSIVDKRGWVEKILEGISPTPVDIVRSDLASAAESPMGEAAGRILKKGVTEKFNPEIVPSPKASKEGYNFKNVTPAFPDAFNKGTMINPKDIIKFQIPRSTEGILQNKDLVIAKLYQNNVPEEMIQVIAHGLDEDQEAISDIAPLIMTQMPNLFERSKYKVFDGKIVDAADKARINDAIARRKDLDSITRAKAINAVNVDGTYPEGLV